MLTDALRRFLEEPRIARFATIDAEGFPHVVPLWFGLEGDDIVVISDRETAKVRNALARPQGSICVGGEIHEEGYLIRGELSVYADEGHRVTHALLHRYERPERAAQLAAEWANDDIVVIRLKPGKVTKVR